jgi:hypothetical protein
MHNKFFLGIIGLVIIGGMVPILLHKPQVNTAANLGVKQPNYGRNHISSITKEHYASAIPTSGPHTNAAQWGVSTTQLPNEEIIHNMEHGGLIISYNPNLDLSIVHKLQTLFAPPFSDASFAPTKAIVMPRYEQKKAIVIASWRLLYETDSFNQQIFENYYRAHVGQSPEPTVL